MLHETSQTDATSADPARLREMILAHADANPSCEALLRSMFVENERLLQPLLEAMSPDELGGYLATVDAIWAALMSMGGAAPAERVEELIRGLQFHSIDFLRRQARFHAVGEYQAENAESVREEVYESEPVMQEYLDGLLLTYVAWPNHHRLLRFYRETYLTSGPSGACLEIGPGHGWLARLQLDGHENNHLLGLDISQYSVRYSSELLRASGLAAERFEIRQHDATTGFNTDGQIFDRIVMAEVLEHVERPDFLLREAAAHAHDKTAIFLSTVVNIEAIDHLYLYRTMEEVRDMVNDCGLTIDHELVMPLQFAADSCPSYEVALICRKRGV